MSYSVLGEMLVAFLLIVNSSRIFFLRYERIDTLAVLSPVALFIILLQIIAWNADVISVLLLVISIISLFTNMHALVRSASRLYVDHYSPVFIIFSVIIFAGSLFMTFILVKYSPVSIKASDFNVIETKIRFKGSFAGGFTEAGYTDGTDAELYVYEPANGKSAHEIVLVGCDKRGDTESYRPYMILLANEGYTVAACDFSAQDGKWFNTIADWHIIRRLAMCISYLKDKDQFERQKDFYTFGMIREYTAMENIVSAKFGSRQFFLVSDRMSGTAAGDVMRESGGKVKGIFALDSIAEYKTPGFGCIEQTDPLLASFFGYTRDKTLFIPRYLVLKTVNVVKGGKK
jgi:hypothetical protein